MKDRLEVSKAASAAGKRVVYWDDYKEVYKVLDSMKEDLIEWENSIDLDFDDAENLKEDLVIKQRRIEWLMGEGFVLF